MGRAASSCCEVLLRDIYNTAGQGHTKYSSPQHHDPLLYTEAGHRMNNVTVASTTCLQLSKGLSV